MKTSPIAHYLREIVYGGNDGIVTTFAVVAGFSGASLGASQALELSTIAVLLFGMANLVGDGLSMSLGNYLSEKSESDVYTAIEKKELDAILNEAPKELHETITLLLNKGFRGEDAQKIATTFKNNPQYWAQWLLQNQEQLPNPNSIKPFYSSIATFLSFAFFGIIPLVPFILFQQSTPQQLFYLSIGATTVALVLLGILRWKVTGKNIIRSIFEIVLIGSAAACAAYFIGWLFR